MYEKTMHSIGGCFSIESQGLEGPAGQEAKGEECGEWASWGSSQPGLNSFHPMEQSILDTDAGKQLF